MTPPPLMNGLPRLTIQRATGAEPFTADGEPMGVDLLAFWQWSSSDLAVNVVRGLLAEFLVAQALGVAQDVRDPWQAFDLRTSRGLTLEVKSCAYLQSWWQKSHSTIGFSIAETTAWDANTNKFVGPKRRQAHAYVFALLRHRDKATLNPLEVTQWEFYLLPTSMLNSRCGQRRSLSLKALLELNPRCVSFADLPSVVSALEDELLSENPVSSHAER